LSRERGFFTGRAESTGCTVVVPVFAGPAVAVAVAVAGVFTLIG
jgi:hypothetical protein